MSRVRKIGKRKRLATTSVSELTEEFKGIARVPGLENGRCGHELPQEGGETPERPMIRYYISSADVNATKFAEAARQHWFVENKLHRSLDVALREDACKITVDRRRKTLPGSGISR